MSCEVGHTPSLNLVFLGGFTLLAGLAIATLTPPPVFTVTPAPTQVPTATSTSVPTPSATPTQVPIPAPTLTPVPTPTIVVDPAGSKFAIYSDIHKVREYFLDEEYFDDQAANWARGSLHAKYCSELIYEGQICFPPLNSPYWSERIDVESYIKRIYWPVNPLIVDDRVNDLSQECAVKMARTRNYTHDSY